MGYHGLLQIVADCANLIEAVSAAVAFHPMSQYTDRVEVALLQAPFDRREVPMAVGEESWNDGFKIRIDMNDDPGRTGLRLGGASLRAGLLVGGEQLK